MTMYCRIGRILGAFLLALFATSLSLACSTEQPAKAPEALQRQVEHEQVEPLPEPQPDPRLGPDGVIKSKTVKVREAPVPIDAASLVGTPAADTLFVRLDSEQMRAYLKKNFPKHQLQEFRNGRAFVLTPPADRPLETSLVVNWQNDGYVLNYSRPVSLEGNSDPELQRAQDPE